MRAAVAASLLFGLVATVAARTAPPASAAPAPVAAPAQDTTLRFPHRRHAGLFPQCTVCHRGIPTGDSAAMFPTASACANCHDGTVKPRVAWRRPTPLVTNLAFSHARHQQSVDSSGQTVTCLTCHRTPGDTSAMAVSPPQPQACIGCHAHAAPSHTDAAARCTTCHVPLARSPLPASRIAALPKPADHAAADWVLRHAPSSPAAASARCAICHARQSCERCHFDAARVPAIQALQPDARVAQLVRGRPPAYPKPASHDSLDWQWKHGAAAGGTNGAPVTVAQCSSCHVQASCRTCHRDGSTPAVAALPAPTPDTAYGVRVPVRPIHAPGWIKDHSIQAAAGANCAACHSRSYCVDCHQGQKAQYHPPDFVAQHAPEAYNNDTQCTACHSTETFCRACHLRTGRGTRTRTSALFHSAQPLWLLNHGQAARQNIVACAACHTQASCTQCHSATGGWGINPHPPGFDAKRAAEANPQSCLACHAKVPGE
ncbi:MAG: cytochrome c3 family protein [Gemmatimonadota bacterium]|nr:cytochrome c3 family protein [Gemmatimonadota bacterium]